MVDERVDLADADGGLDATGRRLAAQRDDRDVGADVGGGEARDQRHADAGGRHPLQRRVVVEGEADVGLEARVAARAQHDVGVGAGAADLGHQPALGGELLEADRRAVGHRVVAGHDEQQRVVAEVDVLDAGSHAHRRQLGVDDRRESRRSASIASIASSGSMTLTSSGRSGRRARRSRVAPGSRPAARVANAPMRTRRPAGARRLADLLLGTARGVEQRRGPGEQQLAGGRGMHAACVAIQQPDADDGLQARDVLGDRGLRVAQDGGRVAEGPPQRDLTKRRQELEIEHHEP